jgi:hypothetical protein
MFEQILEAFGIKDYDDLTSVEKETLNKWVEQVEKTAITIEDVKRGVIAMREGVESELANYPKRDRKDLYLKARLRNLVVIEAILLRPDKAKAALDAYINRVKVSQ